MISAAGNFSFIQLCRRTRPILINWLSLCAFLPLVAFVRLCNCMFAFISLQLLAAKVHIFFDICKFFHKKSAEALFFTIPYLIPPARNCRIGKYASCRERDRVCRGVEQHAVPPSPGTADDSDLSWKGIRHLAVNVYSLQGNV